MFGWLLVSYPERLVFDHSGFNLYGTTVEGGIGHVRLGEGIVFELSPGGRRLDGDGLAQFLCRRVRGDDCPDGAQPSGGVTFDQLVGNLYGTASVQRRSR